MEKDMFRDMGSKMMIFQNVENERMSIRWVVVVFECYVMGYVVF